MANLRAEIWDFVLSQAYPIRTTTLNGLSLMNFCHGLITRTYPQPPSRFYSFSLGLTAFVEIIASIQPPTAPFTRLVMASVLLSDVLWAGRMVWRFSRQIQGHNREQLDYVQRNIFPWVFLGIEATALAGLLFWISPAETVDGYQLPANSGGITYSFKKKR